MGVAQKAVQRQTIHCQQRPARCVFFLDINLLDKADNTIDQFDRHDSVVVRVSASQSVDLWFIPLSSHTKRFQKMVSTAFLFGARHLRDVAENKPASWLVVCLDKALNGTPPPFCKRQVAQTSRKW